jgi:hypothetical protein
MTDKLTYEQMTLNVIRAAEILIKVQHQTASSQNDSDGQICYKQEDARTKER